MEIGALIYTLVCAYLSCLVVGTLAPRSAVGRAANGLKTKADNAFVDFADAIEESNIQDDKARKSKGSK